MLRLLKNLLRLLLTIILLLLVGLGVALWRVNRSLPPQLCRWLEARFSRGPTALFFEEASFNLWRGIELRQVRLYHKQRFGDPILSAEALELKGALSSLYPPDYMIESVKFSGLLVDPEPEVERRAEASQLLDWDACTEVVRYLVPYAPQPIKLELLNSTICGIVTSRTTCSLRLEQDHLYLADIRIDIVAARFSERLDGEAICDLPARRFKMTMHGTLTPDVVERLLLLLDAEHVVEVCRDFDNYSKPLAVNGSMLIDIPPADSGHIMGQDLRAVVEGSGLTYRGMPLKRLHLALQWLKQEGGERRLIASPVIARSDEGQLELAAVNYPGRGEANIRINSTLALSDLLQVLEVDSPPLLTNLTCNTPPTFSLSGTFSRHGTHHFRGTAACESLTVAGLKLQRSLADFEICGTNNLDISHFGVSGYGGGVTGAVALAYHPGTTVPHLTLKADGRNLSLKELAEDLGRRPMTRGTLELQLAGSTPLSTNQLDQLVARGNITIRNGTIFRIPLFAGLTDFLGRNVPGVDLLLMQSDATFPLTATNGVVSVRHLQIEGNLFSFNAKGSCNLLAPGYPLSGVAQLRFFKQKTLIGMLAWVVTLPVSKLMEFRIAGPLTDPTWDYIGIYDRIRDLFRSNPDKQGRELQQ